MFSILFYCIVADNMQMFKIFNEALFFVFNFYYEM